jgi:hypothetical protein
MPRPEAAIVSYTRTSSETPKETICRLLELPSTSETAEITKAFRGASLVNHPDKLFGLAQEEVARRTRLFQELSAAYQKFTEAETPTAAFSFTEDAPAKTIEEELILALNEDSCNQDVILGHLQQLFEASPNHEFISLPDGGIVLLNQIAGRYLPRVQAAFVAFLEDQVRRNTITHLNLSNALLSADTSTEKSNKFNSMEQKQATRAYWQIKLLEQSESWTESHQGIFNALINTGPSTLVDQLLAFLHRMRTNGKLTLDEHLSILMVANSAIANYVDESHTKLQSILGLEISYLQTIIQAGKASTKLQTIINSPDGIVANAVVKDALTTFQTDINRANTALLNKSPETSFSQALKEHKAACERAVTVFDQKVANFRRNNSVVEAVSSWIRYFFACINRSCRNEYQKDKEAKALRQEIKKEHTYSYQFFQTQMEEELKDNTPSGPPKPGNAE